MPSTNIRSAKTDLRKLEEKDYRGFNIFYRDPFFKASLKRKYTAVTLVEARAQLAQEVRK